MIRLIPKNTKVKITFYRDISIADVAVAFVAAILIAIALASNFAFKYLIAGGILIVAIPMFVAINGDRLYKVVGYMLKHIVMRKRYKKNAKDKSDIEGIVPYSKVMNNDLLVNKDLGFVGVIEVSPIDFRMMSEDRQDILIDNTFAAILNQVGYGTEIDLVKLERPLILDNYIADEMQRIKTLADSRIAEELTEKEYTARVDLVQDRISQIDDMNSEKKILYSRYYIAFHGGEMRDLAALINRAVYVLQSNGVETRKLTQKELAAFIRYSIDNEFDERELESAKDFGNYLTPQEIKFGLTNTVQNGKTLTHFVINGYPLHVPNGWGEGIFDLPNTKAVMKLNAVEKSKALKRIDNAILEIGTQAKKNKASDVIDRDTHLSSLQDLLARLQNDNETLFDATVIITAYDEKGKNTVKKQVRRRLREMGFSYNEMLGRQRDVWLTGNIARYDKLKVSRGIPSSSVAACFPFVSNAIVDDKGLIIGENKLPVFVDFFKRNNERVNSNMVVIGKSGSGKSYATKSIIAQLASSNTRVFLLDPENEYTNLAQNFGGKVLDVASARFGKLNPFHVIVSEDDENADGTSNDFYQHLQFLEEFYRLVLRGINSDSLELLNKITQDLYESKGISGQTDFALLTAADYPTFDDLAELIDERLEKEKDEYNKGLFKVLVNYIAKFKTGGRYSNLWNGATSFNPKENFVVFNFQKLLANKNNVVANAQMLLVLKWLENEVIRNRDYNAAHGTERKIVVGIDEAHVFIDEQFPIALDFMYQLAKRIRKYDGMLIIITQNVKDFAGSPQITRKSMAIINLCQYSLIFALSPNDMTDLCKLYEHAGQINAAESEYIVHNGRGTAFFISSPSSRTNIDIVATEYTENQF